MIEARTYGTAGKPLVLLHGGPGAPGYLAPVARRLASEFRVLEPMQRGHSDSPLTVATHVEDLRQVIQAHFADRRVVVVGHSWGAMLALAWAAAHVHQASALVLVGCGTFDPVARQFLNETRQSRITESVRLQIEQLSHAVGDPDERFRRLGLLMAAVDSFDLKNRDLPFEKCDAHASEESWADMIRLQEDGVYPAAFQTIRVPTLMLHGSFDPHPGDLIADGLRKFVPQLERHQWNECGHYPWLERSVGEAFYRRLIHWVRDA